MGSLYDSLIEGEDGEPDFPPEWYAKNRAMHRVRPNRVYVQSQEMADAHPLKSEREFVIVPDLHVLWANDSIAMQVWVEENHPELITPYVTPGTSNPSDFSDSAPLFAPTHPTG